MPSVGKSRKWFVRIDGAHDWLVERVKIMLGWVDLLRLLACLHVGEKKDNPHVHFVIELSSELQKQSFDVRIKKVFQGISGSLYSSKQWDGDDAACAYMFHECDDSVCGNKGFSEDDIARFRALNAATQKVVEVNKGKASGRIVDRVLQEVTPQWTRYDIGKRMLGMIRDGEFYEPGDFVLKKFIEEVYMKSRAQKDFSEYVEERLSRLLL